MQKRRFQELKIALVYDHLTTTYGGAELVLQTLHSIFPTAPIFTTVHQLPPNHWSHSAVVKTSFLQKVPFARKYHQVFAPLHPLAFERFELREYDIIISVSNGPSKGVITSPDQLHVCYLLSPTRYLQQDDPEQLKYFKSYKVFSIPGVLQLSQSLLRYLKRWDAVAASRPDYIITISDLVSQRSKSMYNRVADQIIYPPFQQSSTTAQQLEPNGFLLSLTRLVSYKRVDLSIKAALKTKHQLVIAGEGVMKNALVSLAGSQALVRAPGESLADTLRTAAAKQKAIIFLGSVTDAEKQQLLTSCQALLMPGEEDFGLVGLEAASYGKPTITFYKSGVAEVLQDNTHSIHVPEKSVSAVSEAISRASRTKFSASRLKTAVKEYEVEWFRELFHKTIYHFWQQHSTISRVNQKS